MKTRIALAVTFVLSGLTAGQSPVLAMTPYTCAVGSMAEARDDVDVYNSPVEPRAAYENYFINQGTKGKVLARHEDGWCQLNGVAPGGGDGWVAEDHLKAAEATDAGGGGGGGGTEMGGGDAPAGQPVKSDCKDVGPNEEAAGGSSDPKMKYECEDTGGGNKRCCWVKYP